MLPIKIWKKLGRDAVRAFILSEALRTHSSCSAIAKHSSRA